MAMIKYSVGGPITSIEDQDSVEKKEDPILTAATEQANVLLVCQKCGIQHMISNGESRTCCGSLIKTDCLS